MFVNKHVQNVIVVILSVCNVDHLLCHSFSVSNPSGFSAKKKTSEKERKRQNKELLCQNTPKTIASKGRGKTTLQN